MQYLFLSCNTIQHISKIYRTCKHYAGKDREDKGFLYVNKDTNDVLKLCKKNGFVSIK